MGAAAVVGVGPAVAVEATVIMGERPHPLLGGRLEGASGGRGASPRATAEEFVNLGLSVRAPRREWTTGGDEGKEPNVTSTEVLLMGWGRGGEMGSKGKKVPGLWHAVAPRPRTRAPRKGARGNSHRELRRRRRRWRAARPRLTQTHYPRTCCRRRAGQPPPPTSATTVSRPAGPPLGREASARTVRPRRPPW